MITTLILKSVASPASHSTGVVMGRVRQRFILLWVGYDNSLSSSIEKCPAGIDYGLDGGGGGDKVFVSLLISLVASPASRTVILPA